jgi:hypothetical protein
LWWLLHQLKPGYHTIADFRKNNPVALKNRLEGKPFVPEPMPPGSPIGCDMD